MIQSYRDEIFKLSELGWILEKIGEGFRQYFNAKNPKVHKTICDGGLNELGGDPKKTWQVKAKENDGTRFEEGYFYKVTYMLVGNNKYYEESPYKACVRFTGVNIPKDSVINSAYLKAYIYIKAGTAITKIYGIDEDDTADFSTDPFGRKHTTVAVDWDGPWTVDKWNTSPDIKAIIKEIVNRAGWRSGNALGLFWERDGGLGANNYVTSRSYAYEDGSLAAKLEVTWGEVRRVVPNRGTFNVYAVADTEEVHADLLVDDALYTTPAFLDLTVGTHTIRATYNEQTQSQEVTVTEGVNPNITFTFGKTYTLSVVAERTPPGQEVEVPFTLNDSPLATPFIQKMSERAYIIDIVPSVTIDGKAYNFLQWEDRSVNPTRMLTLSEDLNLTATYKIAILGVEGTRPASQREIKDVLREVLGGDKDVSEANPLPIKPVECCPVQDVREVGVSDKASVQATAVGNTEVIAAPGAGSHLKVKTLHVFNSGDAAVAVGLRFTATGDLHYRATLAANTGYNMNLTHDDWHGGDNENFMVYTSVACTVDVTIGYEVMTP